MSARSVTKMWMRLSLAAALLLVVTAGCGRVATKTPGFSAKGGHRITAEFPSPTVGPAEARIVVTDEAGKGVSGATVRLEANMNHAGMKPVFADATGGDGGAYRARFEWTMAGDWFVIVNAALPNGSAVAQQFDVVVK